MSSLHPVIQADLTTSAKKLRVLSLQIIFQILTLAFTPPPHTDVWQQRWVESKHKSDYGQFKLTAGKFYGDAEKDKGLQTSQDARFYAMSTKFEPFSNEGKTLVIQFTVKHEQNIDCGGGYVKIFPSDLDQTAMHGDSSYNIMFGPDICGPGTKKVHVIFNYKGKNHLISKDIRCKDDEYSHLYTLVLRPDNTYEVKIDNQKVESGSLEEDWDFLPPKKIKDPEAKKSEDWDERAKIDDPEDKKPEDWEKPEHIPDPEAKKPDDWDDEMDGEWEPPMIQNPDYKVEEERAGQSLPLASERHGFNSRQGRTLGKFPYSTRLAVSKNPVSRLADRFSRCNNPFKKINNNNKLVTSIHGCLWDVVVSNWLPRFAHKTHRSNSIYSISCEALLGRISCDALLRPLDDVISRCIKREDYYLRWF
uniref:Calreticulin n=1 Tax=Callorhinchus milii TaxID=7868 RepID=A0A4W3H789_CALMI